MATTKAKLPSSNGAWADSLDQWRGRNQHRVVMPSGARAIIQFPELMPLVLGNAVPNDLVEFARQEITHELGMIGAYAEKIVELDTDKPEDLEKAKEYTATFSRLLKWLVAEHVVVEPKVTVEDLSEESFPLNDLDWLYGVATRRVNEDALGRRLGVARLDILATFPETHGCPEGCPKCVEAIHAFSTADVGDM